VKNFRTGSIARNFLANAVGGSWTIVLGLVIIPIQLRFLGPAAFGLFAFIASLEAIANLFDLGMTLTVAREVAIDASPGLQQSRELLQTLAGPYMAIGLLLGGSVVFCADWLVQHWLKLDGLSVDAAKVALQLGGVAFALRWPVTFFTGVITGRRRFDIQNLIRAGAATITLLGGAIVAVAFADLVAFAAWQVVAAFIELTAYIVACFLLVPGLSLRPRLSRPALARVWRFAASMSLVKALQVGIARSDHLMLSALAPIEVLGYYALAYRVLSTLGVFKGFVTAALFPSFAADYARGAMERLASNYNRAAQVAIYLSAGPNVALMFFGYPILLLWTSEEVAAQTAPILALLAPGFLLGMSVAIASTLATTSGHTGFVVRRNLVALALYLPLLYVAIPRWGGIGAAAVWVIINASFFFTLLPLVQRQIIGESTRSWLERNLLPFVVISVLTFGTARAVVAIAGWHSSIAAVIACAVAAGIYGLWGLHFLPPDLRNQLWTSWEWLNRRLRSAS
jgi:O-antigen/teichoic acid export membrane protein